MSKDNLRLEKERKGTKRNAAIHMKKQTKVHILSFNQFFCRN